MRATGGGAGTGDTVRALAASSLFGGLAPEPLRLLAERAVERTYARGEVVFQRGDPGDALLLVVSGLLKVFDTSLDGAELVLTTVPPGATVGELALADGGDRSASVAALHPTRVLVVSRTDFLHVLRTAGAVAEPLLRHLAGRLRQSTDLAADLVFLDLSPRIAKRLVQMAEESGQPVRPGLVLDGLTQSDLAARVGASRQSTNKVLRRFVQDGWLELDGRRLRLLRPDLLEDHVLAVEPGA